VLRRLTSCVVNSQRSNESAVDSNSSSVTLRNEATPTLLLLLLLLVVVLLSLLALRRPLERIDSIGMLAEQAWNESLVPRWWLIAMYAIATGDPSVIVMARSLRPRNASLPLSK